MSGRNQILDRARKHVERQMALQEAEAKKKLMKKRVTFVTAGAKAYEQRRYVEAAIQYQHYVKLLEDWKGVGEGGLAPSHFDRSKELADLLLLSGVYWDLARLFDKTGTDEKRHLFLHYLEKFILFSRGTSYQPLCAENIRRYLRSNKAKHKAEFKNAYRVMGGSKCFVATSLADQVEFETIGELREFRDQVLKQSRAGRAFVAWYYRAGPRIASSLDSAPRWLRRGLGLALDGAARILALSRRSGG